MIKITITSLISLFAFIALLGGNDAPEIQFTNKLTDRIIDHSSWNMLLKKNVDDLGNVDYKGFMGEQAALGDYLYYLANNTPNKSWSQEEALAYYINLYNAGTVQLILNNYPTKSIKDIKDPWGHEWIQVGSKTYSLGEIEHDILRKMNEPRIHFAINCASFSCPNLLNEAYTPDKMEQQLQKASQDFVNDPTRNKLTENRLQLSNIFKWYKQDFTEEGTLIDYIRKYSLTDIDDKAKIRYITYDWSLNEKK